jgi:hydroxymethylglutaryl-CoA synthase
VQAQALLELRRNPELFAPALRKFATVDNEKSYTDRELDAALSAETASGYERQVGPSNLFAGELGNSYTASLYASIVSTLLHDHEAPRKLLCFSYGSGLASTMFSLSVRRPSSNVLLRDEIRHRLAARTAVAPAEYERVRVALVL